MGHHHDRRLLELAGGNHGLVHLADADAAGIPRHVIRSRTEAGVLERIDRSTYRVAGWPRTFEQRARAATLTAGQVAMASHRTAARLWGLDGVRRAPIEVLVPRWARRTGRHRCIVHETLHLDADDASLVVGIPTTSVERTVIDLAAVEPPRVVEQAMEDALRTRRCAVEDIVDRFVRLPTRGRRGSTAVRRLLEERTGEYVPTDSDFELRVASLLVDAGLPAPTRQHRVRLPGGTEVRLDLAWPRLRVVVECDGVYDHGTTVQLRWDDARQNELVLLGWTVLRFTWTHLVTRPDWVVAQVRAALAAAAAA